ncbi:FAD binding domain-containing protein [Hydrogenophaga sp.]|uniref:FAD binding domain-containing protein n=1 Tax=Hydrogenophaga sp. TaxID=1904254 RepID=UPI003F714B14
MKDFDYCEPTTLGDAVDLLRHCTGQACLFAGGTDLLVQMKEHIHQPDRVINIKKIPGMDDFRFDENQGLTLGALVTTRAVETSPLAQKHYASLARAATDFASIQVRNRATVVGNVCRASPSADTLPPLIADGARLLIYGADGQRELPLENFITGPGKTTLKPDEIVTHIVIPPPPPRTGKVYIKHGRRAQMELATVGAAVTLTIDGNTCKDIAIVLAAVAPMPLRAKAAEALLRGKPLNAQTIAEAAEAASGESRPIGDVRGSADYRREMVAVLVRRAIEQAWQEAV